MRNKIEKTIINIVNFGIFKVIQYFLYGDAKNVCPRECKW